MCRQLKVKADSNAFLDLPPTHSFVLSLVQRYSKRDHQLTEWFIRKIAAAFLSEVLNAGYSRSDKTAVQHGQNITRRQ